MAIVELQPQFKGRLTAAGTVHASQSMLLDGVRIRLETYTNTEDNSWYMDTFDENDNKLIEGIGMVVGLDLWYPYHYLPIPPGALFVQSKVITELKDPTIPDFEEAKFSWYYQTVE